LEIFGVVLEILTSFCHFFDVFGVVLQIDACRFKDKNRQAPLVLHQNSKKSKKFWRQSDFLPFFHFLIFSKRRQHFSRIEILKKHPPHP